MGVVTLRPVSWKEAGPPQGSFSTSATEARLINAGTISLTSKSNSILNSNILLTLYGGQMERGALWKRLALPRPAEGTCGQTGLLECSKPKILSEARRGRLKQAEGLPVDRRAGKKRGQSRLHAPRGMCGAGLHSGAGTEQSCSWGHGEFKGLQLISQSCDRIQNSAVGPPRPQRNPRPPPYKELPVPSSGRHRV